MGYPWSPLYRPPSDKRGELEKRIDQLELEMAVIKNEVDWVLRIGTAVGGVGLTLLSALVIHVYGIVP